jgi:hypothetical protein
LGLRKAEIKRDIDVEFKRAKDALLYSIKTERQVLITDARSLFRTQIAQLSDNGEFLRVLQQTSELAARKEMGAHADLGTQVAALNSQVKRDSKAVRRYMETTDQAIAQLKRQQQPSVLRTPPASHLSTNRIETLEREIAQVWGSLIHLITLHLPDLLTSLPFVASGTERAIGSGKQDGDGTHRRAT